jgi:hypothetical protein
LAALLLICAGRSVRESTQLPNYIVPRWPNFRPNNFKEAKKIKAEKMEATKLIFLGKRGRKKVGNICKKRKMLKNIDNFIC